MKGDVDIDLGKKWVLLLLCRNPSAMLTKVCLSALRPAVALGLPMFWISPVALPSSWNFMGTPDNLIFFF